MGQVEVSQALRETKLHSDDYISNAFEPQLDYHNGVAKGDHTPDENLKVEKEMYHVIPTTLDNS